MPKSSGLPALPKIEFALYVTAAAERQAATYLVDVLADTLNASLRSAAV
jgi:hypothetical protein